MTTKAEEPKFFYELVRILDNAYTGDNLSISREVESIAMKFEKKGLNERANKLLAKAERLKSRSGKGFIQLQQSTEKLGFELFSPSESLNKARNFIPTYANKIKIAELVSVVNKREVFWEAEIPIPNKTLMFGQPGTGKTVSAHYISGILDLPLILVRLDTLISSSLGGTAGNLRKAFDAANKQPCVLFLDEFDAIATNRSQLTGDGAENEMKRVVNSLLQNLDSLNDEVMLFAATNLEREIDPAVWRRFHNRMDFQLPSEDEMLLYLNRNLDDNLLINDILDLLMGRSFSEIEIILNKAKTKCILRTVEMTREIVLESINENLMQTREVGYR
ncbi:ATP-binding protein [Psychrobacillus sp.]|uniref:AAA family ATPase n=1 Tax=Psychrobacillus sp. TaxID=1871623 RepID=UPI0028BDB594|nr:ATP-binding protein [Psychrobacillus sp.]